ncbi:MAG: hypothetical protein JXR63_06085 [Spirochaetales bacterium]|nr:hypothetical protein [Spirochaetales bacterium]
MRVVTDLHSHSGYAGGVGQIELADIAKTMKTKGIDLFGTGDCLLPQRLDELEEQLVDTGDGLFSLEGDSSRFMLQTEIILTVQLDGRKGKCVAHHILLIPSFVAARKIIKLFERFNVKNTIGRPFVVSENLPAQEKFLFSLQEIDPMIEIIPAHIMTPDGVLGSKNKLSSLREFYGEFTPNIRVVETGLSADPPMLEKIPELARLTYISNSDCHSSALDRIGREFTIVEAEDFSYNGIISALRANNIVLTAEFNPAEGRYFQTGHRLDRHEELGSYICEDGEKSCPLCGKELNPGVKQRSLELSDPTITPLKRNYMHLIPLTEVIAYAFGVKNTSSKRVVKEYYNIMNFFKSEIELWLSDVTEVPIDDKIKNHIISIQKGNFSFDPPGYDGQYGELKIHLPN